MDRIPYEKQMALIRQEAQRKETMQVLNQGFQVADLFINRQYLSRFSRADVQEMARGMQQTQKLRVFCMTKVVFDKKEDVLDKLTSVYNALYNLSVTAAVLILGNCKEVSFYFAVRSETNAPLAGHILESTLESNFPGIKLEALDNAAIGRLLEQMEKTDSGSSMLKGLTTVSLVPAIRDKEKKEQFVQGMEKFINTMRGKNYTAVLLAAPLSEADIATRKHGYEQLYSTLSPHAKLSYAYGENMSHAVNQGVTSSFTKSMNESVSHSNSSAESRGTSETRGTSSGSSFGSSSEGGNWGMTSGSSESTSSSYSVSSSMSNSISNSVGTAEAESESRGETDTTGNSKTQTLNYENKGVSNLMKKIQDQLQRIEQWESYGMWETCAYFFSDEIAAAVLAAATYKALMTGETSGVENAHVNVWNAADQQGEEIANIMTHVKYLVHPAAKLRVSDTYQPQMVTPTSLVSGSEVSLLLGMPRKSVAGVAVQEMAEFGRSVVYENKQPARTISIGNIYHMGIEETDTPVQMDLKLFSSHCFITGSSGSGKSYATYNLLDRLLDSGIKMLVIEPAKGEYKMVFGNLNKVNIFTTDANTYRLLRVNPFQFPEKIHILSHIEQLTQIFNASWPLYAAMPAILKESIVRAYVKCGWDVQNSIWVKGISDRKYPVFADVLTVLPEIINTSDYSADSKGDYKGALLTRVQAMTTGLNGLIFRKSEGIPDEVLFDENTIVDLSEVGSEETIALLMGVLIMRLNEYRKSQRKRGTFAGHDSGLNHVTVLEEAHNLLKRTSKDQNQEGANMVGKSVEMIANSIKEMRTYGEGFLIIDQSPLAVDSSVVENTATKIIMNTPSRDACEELGSALSLEEEQTRELSRLNVGVAAVMQKGWMTPVLMKVSKWDASRYEAPLQYENRGGVLFVRSCLVSELVWQAGEKHFSVKPMSDIIRRSKLELDRKEELMEIVDLFRSYKKISLTLEDDWIGRMFIQIIGCEALFSVVQPDGVDSMEAFDQKSRQVSGSEEKAEALFLAQRDAAQHWLDRFEQALEQYVAVEPAEKRCAVRYMLGAVTDSGDRTESPLGLIYNLLSWGHIN